MHVLELPRLGELSHVRLKERLPMPNYSKYSASLVAIDLKLAFQDSVGYVFVLSVKQDQLTSFLDTESYRS